MKKTVKLARGEHRGVEVVFFLFEKDKEIIARIKDTHGAMWIATKGIVLARRG